MKTAMQIATNEVFDILELHDVDLIMVTKVLDVFMKHLETEKQQIIDAYIKGYYELQGNVDSENYYTSTFTTNKETLK